MDTSKLEPKMVVDQRVQIGGKLTDPIDETKAITVKPLGVPPPTPPIWLIIPVGIVFVGLFYLVTRK